MIYYKYEVNENGVIVAIHSSKEPFAEKQITIEQARLIKVGRTTEQQFLEML